MSHGIRLPVVTALITLRTVLPTTAFAQVTMSTPVKPITPIAVTTPLPSGPTMVPASAILHSGSYRLKIHVVAGDDAPGDIQNETDVAVVVSGTGVTINGTSASSGTAALSGTIASNQFTASGSDGAMHVSIAGTGTPSGVAGTLTAVSGSRTAHGTFNLVAMPPSHLRKIDEYGTKPATPAPPAWSFSGWLRGLLHWGS